MVKNPPANAEDIKDAGSIPGLGRSAGTENGNPLQYSFLGNPMDQGAWRATAHGVPKESVITDRLNINHLSVSCEHDPCSFLKNGREPVRSVFQVTVTWPAAVSSVLWLNTLRYFCCSHLTQFPGTYISDHFLLNWLMFTSVFLIWCPEQNTTGELGSYHIETITSFDLVALFLFM